MNVVIVFCAAANVNMLSVLLTLFVNIPGLRTYFGGSDDFKWDYFSVII